MNTLPNEKLANAERAELIAKVYVNLVQENVTGRLLPESFRALVAEKLKEKLSAK